MNDSRQTPNGSPSQPDLPPIGTSRIPYRNILMWILLLCAGVVFMMFFYSNKQLQANVKELTQSEFEQFLTEGLIRSVEVDKQSSGGILHLRGEYAIPSGILTNLQREPIQPNEATETESANGKSVQKKQSGQVKMMAAVRHYRTKVVYTERLDALINAKASRVKIDIDDDIWSGLWIQLIPLLVLIAVMFFFTRRMLMGAGGGVMTFGKSRARMVLPGPNKVTLKDVAGIEEAKSEMQEIVDYLKDPLKFRRLGGKIPRGVLMVGPPGTGKTLLARAIAGEAEVPFFSVSGSDFDEMFVGVGTSRVRDMFEEGKRHAPCLIFIDELDAIGRSRYGLSESGHSHEQTLNALLVEMDGFEANSGVIVLAATNRPDVLDKALLRPGRFDRQITIDLPDLRGRLGILKIHADKICIDPKVDLRVVARGTAGFSGADLANLINEAALLATRTGKDQVGLAELEEARDKVCWGKERRSRRISDNERKLIAYHEAGHALVTMLCEHSTPLHKITIIPRGIAYLGATMQLPEQDRYTIAYSELQDSIAVTMGGRVAEQLIFKELSSGASADIRQATDTARKMVCSYGMSEKLGPLNYANSDGVSFLGHNLSNGESCSEETNREIDLEIRQLVFAAEQRVMTMLTEHNDKLVKLAEALLEHETMAAEDVYKLLDMVMPASKANEDDLEDEPAPSSSSLPDGTNDSIVQQDTL